MKTDGGKAFTGDIKFNDVTPNIGAAMNGPEGIFRAPVAGYYKFSFSASSVEWLFCIHSRMAQSIKYFQLGMKM